MAWSKPGDLDFLATLPPEAPPLRDMPEVWAGLGWYLEAFRDLTWSRPVSGFGSIGYIPLSEIAAWAGANGVVDVPLLMRHIRALDVEYVKYIHEKQQAEAEAKRGKSGDQSRPADERRDPASAGGA